MLTFGRYLSSAAATTPSLSPLRTLTFSLLRRHPLRFLSSASAAATTAVEPETRGGGSGGAGGGTTRSQWKAAIDFKWIRDNRDVVATNIRNRNSAANLDVVLQLYDQYLALQKEVERLRAERNAVANKMKGKLDPSVRQALVDEGKNRKESLIALEEDLVQLTDKLQLEAQSIPNTTHPDVPVGDEESSVTRKEVGSQRNFSFTIKDHLQLGKDLDLFDFDAASEIQSAINDGRLNFSEMQIDKQPFPTNTMELEGKKMLIRPSIVESANKNNVVIGEPRKNKDGDKVLGRKVVLDKQPGGKEVLKITIKNPILGRQPQMQEDVRAKFIKPKSPEVGKWKTNEAKVQRKRIKPTFDMLLSKYANQAAGSSSNRSSHLKRSRSPPKQEFQHHERPYGSWAPTPWMAPPPYAPYYMGEFNEGWGHPPMAPYAFHPGWAAPRRPARERLSYPTQGRLSRGANRSRQLTCRHAKVHIQFWRFVILANT